MTGSNGFRMLPLSSAQLEHWFAQRLDPAAILNGGQYVEIQGPVDPGLFESALRKVIREAETLRLCFIEGADGPRQFISPPEPWTLPYFELSAEREPLSAAKKWMLEDMSRQPNLANGPLFGFALFKVGSESFLWYQRYHHLVNDGFGRRLITRRAAEIYTEYVNGAGETRSPFGSFEAFLEEDAAYRKSEKYAGDREYWISVFRDSPQPLSLSRKAATKSNDPLRRTACLSLAHREKLHAIGQAVGASLPQMLTGIVAGYVGRMTGAEDFALGVASQNRVGALAKQTPLVASNALPLRIKLSRETTLLDLAQQVTKRVREGFRHQRYRIEELRRDLGLFAPTQRLVWPGVNYQLSDSELSFAGHRATTHSIRQSWADELIVTMYDESSSRLEINFDASSALYGPDELENYLTRFMRLLEAAVETPDRPVASLDLLMPEERQQAQREWQRAECALPTNCMEELFEEQARRLPDAPAVIFDEIELSYRELNQRANQLARHLRTLGVNRESRVAICLEQGPEVVVALLAVLKAGGVYIPLDPQHPPERLAYMLEDSGARILVTERKLKQAIADTVEHKVCVEVDVPEINGHSGENLTTQSNSESLVYMMYTSGSTGKPKGTAIPQRAVVRLVRETDYVRLGVGDRIAQLANTSFDAATFEIWGALLNGAAVVILPHEVALLPARLAATLRQFRVTTLFLTTALFNEVAREAPSAFSGLRDLLFGGEAVDPNWVRSVLERGAPARLFHVYGPTENTTFSSWHHVTSVPAEAATVPIGKAIANTRAYVLDGNLQVTPTGAVGELYLAGKGLSRGYWNRAALTAERFVADPFGTTGERMYRTGDLVRRLLDGSLEFVGRNDDQLKIRGFRVEIGEIETVLRTLEGVRDAVVVAREFGAEKWLAGYVVPLTGHSLEASSLRQKLAQKIPNYMAPAVILVLEDLPLNANGKVDRQALPVPIFALAADYCPPRTPQEELLCNIFGDVLGQEYVGIEHNFFELGGNSLLATRFALQVRAELGLEIAIRDVLEEPTVAGLARRLNARANSRPPLEARSRPPEIPLSHAQSRLWFIDQLEGSSTEYNMPYVLRLLGHLDCQALQSAFDLIVQRHESLRTRFESVDGEPVQIIDPQLHIPLVFEDLACLEPTLQARRVESTLRQEWKQPFDLARGPLLRMKLLRLSEQEHILLRTTHHIVFDGWSHGIFNRELGMLYEACSQKKESPLRHLALQYADFALWQRKWLDEEWLGPGLKYWKKQLAGIPERLALPRDRSRPPLQTFHGERCHITLNSRLANSLRQVSRENHATLYMVLLAGFQLLVSRYSGQQDIVIGSPIANRQEAQLEGLIGFFVNSLVMRGHLDPHMRVRDLLSNTRRTALEAFEHQDVPFERLVEELVPDRSLDATPLFQVAFALQNAPMGVQRLKGLDIEPVVSWQPRVRFDLEVHIIEQGAELECQWIYNRDLFDRWRIEQMARHYQRLLEVMIQDPDRPLHQLEMLNQQERRALLHDHNGTRRSLPPATLPELFEQQAQQTPDADALILEEQRFSYLELNERANCLAHRLIASGVGTGSLVAVRMERGLEMVVGLLAILKAGGAYVPLDLAYPRQRVLAMLADSRAALLLTTANLAQELGNFSIPTILFDSANDEAKNDNLAQRTAHPSALAYVMYTSGSTGVPKGIAVSHEAIIRLVRETTYVNLRPGDRIAQVANASFDAATFEIWGALLNGGVVVVIPRETTLSPPLFVKRLQEQHIDVLFLTTALFNQIAADVPRAFSSVRDLLFGGEAVDPHWVRRVLDEGPPRRLLHVYGPTENTTFSAWHCVESPPDGAITVPIGRPIENTRVYVLDGSLQPVPTGGVGELCVAGAGLAQGYLGRPVQTAERFVAEPYGSEPGGRMYRTGDLVRWNRQGALEFVGRADHQVKVRGFRVELGEIEFALKAHPGIQDALVTVREYDGQKQLLGYVVAQQDATQEADAAKSHIVQWQQLYQSLYQQSRVDEFSIVGWNSSYTDGPIASEEMGLWVKETVGRLTKLRPKRVLEIGCGTGLLLTRLASGCESYVGLDFSEEVLKKLGSYISEREHLRHVELRQGLAHEISFAPDQSFDLVILNSVAQYFPDIDYLLEVLAEAVRVTQPNGHIFVGDVRSLPLHEAYHASVQLFKAAPEMLVEDLRQRVYYAMRNDKELVVDPAIFDELQRCWEKVGRANIALKVEEYDNELSRFRYDVTLRLGKKERLVEPEHELSWRQSGEWQEEVEFRIRQQPGKSVILRGVKDRRVAAAVETVHLLHAPHDNMFNAAQLRVASEAVGGEDPHEIAAWAQRIGIELCWQSYNGEGVYDVIFNPEWQELPVQKPGAQDWRQYGNAPARSASIASLGRILQENLRQSLPEYMVPAAIMALPSWPLNANGKVDRRKLPLPERSGQDYRAPRTAREEVMCEIFAEILGVDRIGIDDNFFKLGGHSLMATRLINRLRAVLGVDLEVRQVFESATVAQLAEYVASQQHPSLTEASYADPSAVRRIEGPN